MGLHSADGIPSQKPSGFSPCGVVTSLLKLLSISLLSAVCLLPAGLSAPARADSPTPDPPQSILVVPPHAPGFAPIPGLTGQYGDFRGRFEALTDPKIIPAAQLTELGDDEEVLGLTLNGASRAYPARFIAWHHIVNDVLGGKPVAVTYCSVCNSGVAYDPVVGGKRRLFNVFGLFRGVMAMIDPSTQTVWSHLAGEALLGPDRGKTLTALPMVNTTWGEWKRLHPESTTPAWDTHYRHYYSQIIVSGQDYLPSMFRPTLEGLRDDRLAPYALVLAVRVGEGARAYPYAALAKAADVVQETVGGTPLVAFYTPKPQTGAAFDRRLDGQTLDFTRTPDAPGRFTDKQTHTQWTVEGRGLAGPLAGKQLTRLFSLQSEWYGWSAYFPQTTVYTEPSQAAPALLEITPTGTTAPSP